MAIYNKTQSDQETGYGSLKTEADALKPVEPKKPIVAKAPASIVKKSLVGAVVISLLLGAAAAMAAEPTHQKGATQLKTCWETCGTVEASCQSVALIFVFDEPEASIACGAAAGICSGSCSHRRLTDQDSDQDVITKFWSDFLAVYDPASELECHKHPAAQPALAL